jgi:C-terminal processing protease CtpA/Prc
MASILDQYGNADALVLDLRSCRGGTLRVMDVLFSRLYARPTQLMTMDTRTGADGGLEDMFASRPTMREIPNAPRNIRRWQHWAQPTLPASELADARVFVLTDQTASACEHLSLALKATGRATLIGATTRGAGHYGGEESFGGGRFQVFIPVGRTYIERTGQGWEGTGIAPDRATAPQEALNEALRQLHVTPTAAAQALAHTSPARDAVRVDAAASPTRRYGIGTAMQPGAESLEVLEIAPGFAASRSGLQAGDRIVAINGAPVVTLTPEAFSTAMRASPLTLEVLRGSERMTFQMSLEG